MCCVMLTQGTVVARKFAGRAGSVKLYSTDATHFVLWHVPLPRSDSVPLLDLDLHGVSL